MTMMTMNSDPEATATKRLDGEGGEGAPARETTEPDGRGGVAVNRERPDVVDEVLIEEVGIDGMCGVY